MRKQRTITVDVQHCDKCQAEMKQDRQCALCGCDVCHSCSFSVESRHKGGKGDVRTFGMFFLPICTDCLKFSEPELSMMREQAGALNRGFQKLLKAWRAKAVNHA